MKRAILSIIFILFGLILPSYGQDETLKDFDNKGLNIYMDYSKYFDSNHDYKFHGLSAAFIIEGKKNNQHEIHLTRIGAQSSTRYSYNGSTRDSVKIKDWSLGLRYQHTQNILRKTNAKFMPQLGLAWHMVIYHFGRIPYGLNNYKITQTFYLHDFELTPQLVYSLSRLLRIYLSFPLNFNMIVYSSTTFHDPNLSKFDQGGSSVEYPMKLAKMLNVRIGCGIRF